MSSRAGRAAPWLERGLVAGVVALLGYLLVIALRLRVDYFDSYQNILNAQALIGQGASGSFSILRGPLFPVLLLPAAIIGAVAGSPTLTLILSHLTAVAMLGALLWLTYLLFRLQLGRLTALAAVALLASNVLIIGNGPLAKEDIPGTMFLTAAFLFYLRGLATGDRWSLLAAGLAIGLATSTRYSLLPVPFVVVACYEVVQLVPDGVSRQRLLGLLVKAAFLIVLPLVVIFAIPSLVYVAAHRSTLLHAPAQFVQDLLTLRGVANAFNEDALRNYRFIVEMVTWPLVGGALVGVIATILRRQRVAVFYALWFAAVFLLHTYAIVHKEARYLIAALPPAYWFTAVGIESVSRLGMRLRDRFRLAPAAGVALIVLALVVPGMRAVSAVWRYTDPVYSETYEPQVSRYAFALAAGHHITWIGPYYPLHPRDDVFDAQDPFTYIYHFYWHVVSFWTLHPVGVLDLPATPATDGSSVRRVHWSTIDGRQDGEVLIVNQERFGYDTGTMPATLEPLVVERLGIERFAASGPGTWSSADGAGLAVTGQGGTWSIRGNGLKDGPYDLYVGGPDGSWLTPITVAGGSFVVGVEGPSTIDAMALVSYDGVRTFPPPP